MMMFRTNNRYRYGEVHRWYLMSLLAPPIRISRQRPPVSVLVSVTDTLAGSGGRLLRNVRVKSKLRCS